MHRRHQHPAQLAGCRHDDVGGEPGHHQQRGETVSLVLEDQEENDHKLMFLWCSASGQGEDSGQTVGGDQRTSDEAARLPEWKSKAVCFLNVLSVTSSVRLLTVCSPQTVEDFLTNIEACAEVCGFMLKKGDKKKER